MTRHEVTRRLREHDKQVKGKDFPSASVIERRLWRDLLVAICNGTAEDPRRMAEQALRTDFNQYPRGKAEEKPQKGGKNGQERK